MNIKAEQLFFGSGTRGYELLAASHGAEPYQQAFSAFCGAIATPDSSYSGESILMSRPVGDHLLAVRCGFGRNDSAGRRTLFFHGLVLPLLECGKGGVSAFSLADAGAFRGDVPPGTVQPLMLDLPSGSLPSGACDFRLPSAIVEADQPQNSLFRKSLGNRVNDIAWSTYAFWPMKGVDLYALSARAPRPEGGVSLYDAEGKALGVAPEPKTAKPPSSHNSTRPANHPSAQKGDSVKTVSMVLNAALVLVCAMLLLRGGKTEPPETPPSGESGPVFSAADLEARYQEGVKAGRAEATQTASEHMKTEIEKAKEAGRLDFLQCLKADLPKERIDDLRATIADKSRYELLSGLLKPNAEKLYKHDCDLLRLIQDYISFVNTNFYAHPQP